MSRQIGLIVASTETGCTRAVLRDGHIVLQTLTIAQEVAVSPEQLTEVQTWVEGRTYRDPLLEELARVEAMSGDGHA